MLFDETPFTLDRVIRLLLAAAILWALIRLFGYLSDVLIPFALGLILAYLTHPLVSRIQKVVKNRLASIFLALSSLALVVVFLLWILIPMIAGEINHMGKLVSELVENSDFKVQAEAQLSTDLWNRIKSLLAREEVQQYLSSDKMSSLLETAAQKMLPGIWQVISGTAGMLLGIVGLFVILLYLVFLLLDYDKITHGWQELLPKNYRQPAEGFVNDFTAAMERYFRGQALVASLVGLLMASGFWLIGLPLGILLGLFIGLLNMVPYLQLIGLIPAFFLALIHALETGMNFWLVLGLVGLVFAVVQVIQDGFLVPKIMGKITGLSPAIILLSLSVWGKLLGMLGLLIALPITCLLWAYYRRFVIDMPVTASMTEDSEY